MPDQPATFADHGPTASGSYVRRVSARRAYVAVYLAAASTGGWPFDVGDDPSFRAARHAPGSDVTWGVCRTDLRNALRPGDVVVFIAAEDLSPSGLLYR